MMALVSSRPALLPSSGRFALDEAKEANSDDPHDPQNSHEGPAAADGPVYGTGEHG